ncbi:hypothetical protein JCM10213_003720 [Rhodosporidiobolus nylandii]
MASAKLYDCTVCANKADKRCSGCSAAEGGDGVFFCSRECAKLLWPTHKANCPSRFPHLIVPPLPHGDIAKIEALRSYELRQPHSHVRRTDIALEELRLKGLYEGDWAGLVKLLYSGAKDIKEPERTRLHILVLNWLPEQQLFPGCSSLEALPWQLWSRVAASFVRPPLTGLPAPFPRSTADPLILARPFLEQLLVFLTVISSTTVLNMRAAEMTATVTLPFKRAQEAFKELEVDNTVREKWEHNAGKLASGIRMMAVLGPQ